jgi:DNA-binding NarL/FixJ family response regulator
VAERGKPLKMDLRLQIKQQTASGAKIKPLARELAVSRNTVRKYAAK